MVKEKIVIINKLGLHTRAAAKLVAAASHFQSKIELFKQEQRADCKSIMSIILLGAHKGTHLELIITGADELEARDAILELINAKFEEIE